MNVVNKENERVQDTATQPYIGIDMAAGEDMTAYEGKQDAQKPAEAAEEQKIENPTQETEKGQKGEIDSLQEWLAKFPEEVRAQQVKVMEEFCEKNEVTIEKLAAELLKASEQIENVLESVVNNIIRPAIEYLTERLQEYCNELVKAKMSNNERRRRGIPMVRRRAHIRNIRNGRKCLRGK